jgi:hypothetical protein
VWPDCAPINLFEARAEESSAVDVSKTSLDVPVVPDVPIATAALLGANSDEISPKPRVGPSPTSAAVISLASWEISHAGLSHAGLTRRIFRCDEVSIATVGYR